MAPPTDQLGNLHPALRAFWHPVAFAHEVTAPFATTLLDEPLLLVRDRDGTVRAVRDECPHRGAPLSRGHCTGDELVCGFHGWRFDLDGHVTAIPSLGPGATLPSRARLEHPFAVTERHGLVWVALDEPRLPICDWPDGDDPALGAYVPPVPVEPALAAYQTENLLDASHFPFLHPVLSDRNPLTDRHELVEEHPLGFRTTLRKLADDATSTEGWLRYTLQAPFTVVLRSEEAGGALRTSFFQAIQPIDAERTRMFFLVRVPQTDGPTLAAMCASDTQVLAEDQAMTAAQRRTGIDLSDRVDLHVRADRNGVLYRRVLRTLLEPD